MLLKDKEHTGTARRVSKRCTKALCTRPNAMMLTENHQGDETLLTKSPWNHRQGLYQGNEAKHVVGM